MRTAQRDRQAVVLRSQGLTYEEIKDRLGYGDRSAARKAVNRGLARWRPKSPEALRYVEFLRLEALHAALCQRPLDDESAPLPLKTVDLLRAIHKRLSRLTGSFTAELVPAIASWHDEAALEQATPDVGGAWTDILEWRARGLTFDELAEKFDLPDRAAARRHVEHDLRDSMRGASDVYVAQLVRALDEAHQQHWAAAIADPPNHKAIKTLLRIHDRRADLLNIYPKRPRRAA